MLSHFIVVPLHPLFWCLITYAAGILCSSKVTLLVYVTGVSLLCALFLVTRYIKVQYRRCTLTLLFATVSFFAGVVRYTSVQKSYDKIVDTLSQNSFDCVGKIKDIQHYESKAFKTRLTVTIDSISHRGRRQNIFATLELFTISCPPFLVGDRIYIPSLHMTKQKNHTFEHYLRKEGICSSLHVPHLKAVLIERPFFSLNRFFHSIQRRLYQTLSKKLSPECRTLFFSLFFGITSKKGTATYIKKQCTFWGIAHYLARSGLHVILILYGWQVVLRVVHIHFFLKQLLLLFFLLLYHALTVPTISFNRALITFIMSKVCVASSLLYKQLHLLSLTTLLILLYNPEQLFFIDFQLSFGLTFALTWFHETLIKIQRIYNIIENK